ncbi:hypothetical protein AFLA_013418 [Aspergillus flavus NRRL3357]|nr:hypothetical protein AFLA_013418 [Aspergillus flavus NRRL3357]
MMLRDCANRWSAAFTTFLSIIAVELLSPMCGLAYDIHKANIVHLLQLSTVILLLASISVCITRNNTK